MNNSSKNISHKVTTSNSTENNFYNWKLGSIDVRTATEDLKIDLITEELERAKLSICCIQEFRRIGEGSAEVKGSQNTFTYYWSGYTKKT